MPNKLKSNSILLFAVCVFLIGGMQMSSAATFYSVRGKVDKVTHRNPLEAGSIWQNDVIFTLSGAVTTPANPAETCPADSNGVVFYVIPEAPGNEMAASMVLTALVSGRDLGAPLYTGLLHNGYCMVRGVDAY